MLTRRIIPLATAVLVMAGCEYLERSADSGELALSMEIPGTLGMGEEGAVLLMLENTSEQMRDDARIELFLPDWIEVGRVEPAGTEVTMIAAEGDEIRLSYRTAGPGIEPGDITRVTQSFRIPPREWWETGRSLGDRTIRARLVGEQGEVLGAEVRSRLELDTPSFPGWRGVPP